MPRICCIAVMVLLCLVDPHAYGAATKDEHVRRVDQTMSLINVFPGLTATSTPISIDIDASDIPDDAVVERVSVVTGRVGKGSRVTALNAITSYNIQGPGMPAFVRKGWAGKTLPTTFSAGELGGPVPVKGVWRLSMTGNNVGRSPATTTHQVSRLKIVYRVPEK